jgi:hypothetical protein
MASFFPFSMEQFDHAESLLTPADRGGCTFVRNGTEGSNSSHSATQSGLQRNRAALLQESLKIAAIPQLLASNRTGESVPSNLVG